MKPYSLDLRTRVAAACELVGSRQQQVADRFGVSISFSINYIKALESSLKISLSNRKVYSSNIKTYSDYVTTTKKHLDDNVDYYASHSSEKAARNKDISDYNKNINSLRVYSKNNEDIIKKTQLKIKQEKIELLTYEKICLNSSKERLKTSWITITILATGSLNGSGLYCKQM